ncbi:DUF4232 domain-containing protein [Streptomyces sp. MMBL 11-3]|uniref:DUF4232 domain-containing protein n=1 Tax=Streptomyces sp. MMBL 11-3 TaxID=3382639 RepID=UPI0039B5B319
MNANRTKRPVKSVAVSTLVVLGVLGLGACGGSDGTEQASASASARPSASESASAQTGGTAAATTEQDPTDSPTDKSAGSATGSPGTRSDCTTDDLRAGLKATGQEMNSKYFDLTLTNTAESSCALHGYAGLSLTDAEGGRIGRPATRSQDGSAENVVLKPGQAAHAVVKTPGKGVTDGKCWPEPARIKVFPPDNTAALTASPAGLQVCGDSFNIGPFTAHAP